MNKFFIWLIRLYQKISKGGPRVCRFEPTCSSYAVEALQKRGFWRAFLLIAGRLLRCHPLNPGGYDPVK